MAFTFLLASSAYSTFDGFNWAIWKNKLSIVLLKAHWFESSGGSNIQENHLLLLFIHGSISFVTHLHVLESPLFAPARKTVGFCVFCSILPTLVLAKLRPRDCWFICPLRKKGGLLKMLLFKMKYVTWPTFCKVFKFLTIFVRNVRFRIIS